MKAEASQTVRQQKRQGFHESMQTLIREIRGVFG
jgi:hypothetical protein